ncbi:MAG: TonB-dependent receptor [Reichenbachiella sp.]
MMKLKVCSVLLGLLLIGVMPVMAQFSLSGTIKDDVTQKPIADAQVIVKEKNLIVSTNAKGQYEIKDLKQGYYTIVIFSYQFESVTIPIGVDQNTVKDFYLKDLSHELTEVVIMDRKDEVFGLKRLQPVEGTAIYAGKKTEVVLVDQMMGNMATNNARQVFAQVVGLNIYDSNDGGLQLSIGGRGLDPNRSSNFNTRQNGYDISADVLGYPESYYTPPVEGLSEIEVIRGAASLQYGTQFGGLINFKMKQPVKAKKIALVSRQTVGSYGLFTSFNSLSGTVGKFSYYTFFNYKQGNGYRPNSEFDSKNFFGNVQYQISDKTNVSFDFTYLKYVAQQAGGLWDDKFEEDPRFSNRERNWFEVDWKLYAFRLEHKFNSKTDLTLNVFGLDAQRNAVGFRGIPGEDGFNRSPVEEVDEIDEFGVYTYNRDLMKGTFENWGAEIRLLTRYNLLGKDAVFLIGSKYYNAHNTSQQGPGSNNTDADFNFDYSITDYPNVSSFKFPNQNIAVFGENIFFLTDNLSITPGFRFEHIKTQSNGTYVDAGSGEVLEDNLTLPRDFVLFGIGVSQSFNVNLELYANLSQNYRSVTFSDIRTVSPSFIIDENIQDERGFTMDIGLRGKWNKYVSYDLGVYSLLYQDRIGIIFDDRANRVRTNIADAIIVGLEAFGEWNLISTFHGDDSHYRLKAFANVALTGSQYFNAIEGNNNVDGRTVEFIPLFNLKSGINAGYKNLLANLQFTYMTEQYTDAQNSDSAPEGDPRSGIIGQIPSYQIMDFSLSYTYKWLKVETGINNLTNHNYFTRRATGYPGPGIIPSDGRSFYLTLGFKI